MRPSRQGDGTGEPALNWAGQGSSMSQASQQSLHRDGSFAFDRQGAAAAPSELLEATARLPDSPHQASSTSRPPSQPGSRRATSQPADNASPVVSQQTADQSGSRRSTGQPLGAGTAQQPARGTAEQLGSGSSPVQLQQVQAELASLQQRHLAALQELQALQSHRLRYGPLTSAASPHHLLLLKPISSGRSCQ